MQLQSLGEIYKHRKTHQSHEDANLKSRLALQFQSMDCESNHGELERKLHGKSPSVISKKVPRLTVYPVELEERAEEPTSRYQLKQKNSLQYPRSKSRHSLEVPNQKLKVMRGSPLLKNSLSGMIFQTDEPKLDPEVFGEKEELSAREERKDNFVDTCKTVVMFDGLSEIPASEKQVDETQKTLKN